MPLNARTHVRGRRRQVVRPVLFLSLLSRCERGFRPGVPRDGRAEGLTRIGLAGAEEDVHLVFGYADSLAEDWGEEFYVGHSVCGGARDTNQRPRSRRTAAKHQVRWGGFCVR